MRTTETRGLRTRLLLLILGLGSAVVIAYLCLLPDGAGTAPVPACSGEDRRDVGSVPLPVGRDHRQGALDGEHSAEAGHVSGSRERRAATRPGALCSLRIIDERGNPITTAVATRKEDLILNADALGVIELHGATHGDSVVLAAPGFCPSVSAVRFGHHEQELAADPGLRLQLVWEGSAEPVPEAVVRRVWVSQGMQGLVTMLDRVVCPSVTTDESGLATIYGVWVGEDIAGRETTHNAGLEITHPGAPTTILPGSRFYYDGPLPLETPLVRVAVADGMESTLLRFVDRERNPLQDTRVIVRVEGVPYDYWTDDSGTVDVDVDILVGSGDQETACVSIELDLGEGRSWLAGAYVGDLLRINGATEVVDYQLVEGTLVHPWPEEFEVVTAAARWPERSDASFGAWPRPYDEPGSLHWQSADSRGRFVLTSGWQGTDTCVIVQAPRHSPGGLRAAG